MKCKWAQGMIPKGKSPREVLGGSGVHPGGCKKRTYAEEDAPEKQRPTEIYLSRAKKSLVSQDYIGGTGKPYNEEIKI